MRMLAGISGALIALFSLMMVVMAIGDLVGMTETKTELPVVFALLIFFIGTTIGGAWLARWGLLRPRSRDEQAADRAALVRQLLKAAQAHQGELTLMQAVAETTLSIEQGRELLEELVAEGMAQMQIDEAGVIVYCFPDFLPDRRA